MNIEALGVSKEELLKMVVDKSVEELLDREYDRISLEIDSRISEKIKDAYDQIKDKVNERVDNITTEVVLAELKRPFQRTNHYGEPKGAPTTIEEIIIETSKEYMTTEADSRGEVRGRNSYASEYEPRASWMTRKIVTDVFSDQIKQSTKEATDEIRKQFPDKLADAIGASIRTVIGTQR